MPFTHYPKLVWNLIFAWRWPAPPNKPGFLNEPPFADYNLAKEALPAGGKVVAYNEASNFTRFMGSFASDQPLRVTLAFSNDDVTDEGNFVTDDNLKTLHYDAIEGVKDYDPAKQQATGKFFAIIYGRWLRVEVENLGKSPTEFMRVYIRGSVF